MRRQSRESRICSKGRSKSRDRKGGRGRRSRGRRGKSSRTSRRRYMVNLKSIKGRGRGRRGRKGRCRWQIYRIGNKARSRATKRTEGRGRSGRSRDRSGR